MRKKLPISTSRPRIKIGYSGRIGHQSHVDRPHLEPTPLGTFEEENNDAVGDDYDVNASPHTRVCNSRSATGFEEEPQPSDGQQEQDEHLTSSDGRAPFVMDDEDRMARDDRDDEVRMARDGQDHTVGGDEDRIARDRLNITGDDETLNLETNEDQVFVSKNNRFPRILLSMITNSAYKFTIDPRYKQSIRFMCRYFVLIDSKLFMDEFQCTASKFAAFLTEFRLAGFILEQPIDLGNTRAEYIFYHPHFAFGVDEESLGSVTFENKALVFPSSILKSQRVLEETGAEARPNKRSRVTSMGHDSAAGLHRPRVTGADAKLSRTEVILKYLTIATKGIRSIKRGVDCLDESFKSIKDKMLEDD